LFPALSFAGQYRVVRVVDGDTIVINYHDKYEKVRFLCVDTPESVHPDKKRNIPIGKVASKYTPKAASREDMLILSLRVPIEGIMADFWLMSSLTVKTSTSSWSDKGFLPTTPNTG